MIPICFHQKWITRTVPIFLSSTARRGTNGRRPERGKSKSTAPTVFRIHRTRASAEGQEPLFDRHRLYVRFLVAEPLLALRSEQFGTETQRIPHITTSFSYHFESLYSKGVLSARRLKNLLKKDGLGKSISSDI